MVEYAYTKVHGKIGSLLSKVREVGIPPKVTTQWIKSVGFKSSNDLSLVRILRYVGFVDESNVPTSRWKQYRGANHRRVLGDAIRAGYSELYKFYPDAHDRTESELEHVFSTSSAGGRQVVGATVGTFRALVKEAEFARVSAEEGQHPHPDAHSKPAAEETTARPLPASAPASAPASGPASGPALHIDVQIHISPDASLEQIDKIFSSMAKHLYNA